MKLYRLIARLDSLARKLEETAKVSAVHPEELRVCAQRVWWVADRAAEQHDALTASQARVLSFIRSYIREHGVAPTRKEIAEALGFSSPNAAQEHINKLEVRGYLTRTAGGARELRLNKRASL